ncbi:MAG: GNAT family N-acetyltransferase [Bacteroidota bacterium]
MNVQLRTGYRPGLIGEVVRLHGHYYSRYQGLGLEFESQVAREMGEFIPRLANPKNGIWYVDIQNACVGSISIDGEAMGEKHGKLRWFILDARYQGRGIGRQLLTAALDHCDRFEFNQVTLFTFAGLDAAKKLYLSAGFVLEETWSSNRWDRQLMEQKYVRQRQE